MYVLVRSKERAGGWVADQKPVNTEGSGAAAYPAAVMRSVRLRSIALDGRRIRSTVLHWKQSCGYGGGVQIGDNRGDDVKRSEKDRPPIDDSEGQCGSDGNGVLKRLQRLLVICERTSYMVTRAVP